MFSDQDISGMGHELVEPFDPEMVQPASLELRLDKHFLVRKSSPYLNHGVFDPKVDNDSFLVGEEIPAGESFVLAPQGFALASTYEKVTLPNEISARFEGKSSLGRIGLFTHITAGFIDPGFSGHITLELFNALDVPLVLYPGMKIGQLCFFRMYSTPRNPYGSSSVGSHYQGQRGPTRSKIHERFYTKPL